MPNDSLFQKNGQATSLRDLFLKSKSSITDAISVATLGIITGIMCEYSAETKYGIAQIKLVPARDREAEGVLEGYFFKSGYTVGNIVLAVFTDYDFRPALKTADWTTVYNSNRQTHKKDFAVLINLSEGASSNESE